MASTLSQIRALYSWNDKAQRWMVRGRFVSESSLKLALVQYAAAAGEEVKELAGQMARGEIRIEEWQLATADRIKNSRLAMTAAAKGGFRNLTAADYGRLGSQLRQQYRYLQGFALDVEAGRLGAGRIVQRAALYAAGAAGWYENERRDGAAGIYTHERRVLAASEHCSICVEEAARGWVEVGTLRPIGDSPCRANCLCKFEFDDRPS
jgi:hypothetical protein